MTNLFPKKADRTVYDAITWKSAENVWTGTVGVSPMEATLPLSNITDVDIGKVARWGTVSRSRAVFKADNGNAANAVAIINHSLKDGAQWRVISAGSSPFYAIAPTAVEASTNYTGPPAVSEIDNDPDDDSIADGHTVTTTGNPTSVRYSFATPTSLDTDESCEILVRVANTAQSGTIEYTITLYEAGSGLGTYYYTEQLDGASTEGVMSIVFPASALSDPTGADIEVLVAATGISGSNSGRVLAVQLTYVRSNLVDSDTGWVDVAPVDPSISTLPPVAMEDITHAGVLDDLYIWIWNESGGTTYAAKAALSTFDIGRVLVGSWLLSTGKSHRVGKVHELKDDTKIIRTRDGQTHGIQGPRYQRVPVEFVGLTRAERNSFLYEMASHGHAGEVCVFTESSAGSNGYYDNLYGRFEKFKTKPTHADLWSASFEMEQRVSDQ